jgi:methylmalonyl-CoA/ethylmalonyl-CoA epimerase
MIQGIGHIGVAVDDIEKVLGQLCRALDLETPEIKLFPDRGMRTALIRLGAVDLELLEETAAEGDLSGVVRQRGSFIHHLCLISDHLEADIEALASRGVRFSPGQPARGLRGKRIIFAQEGLLGEVPVELSEP